MATLLRPDGTSEPLHPAAGEVFALSELQAAVGGYIEAVYFPTGHVMLINEEGKLHLQLPPNPQATYLAHANRAIHPDDHIVGNALVLTRTELGEDDDSTEV
jgi:hypothetical protein